jgi:hypothetical protein
MIRLDPAVRGETLVDRHVTMVGERRFRNGHNVDRSTFGQLESFDGFGRQYNTVFTFNELNAHHHFTILRLEIDEVYWGIDNSMTTAVFIH